MPLPMEIISVDYFTYIYNIRRNESKYDFHLYISDYSEQNACYSHSHIFHLFNKSIELGLLVSGLSNIW